MLSSPLALILLILALTSFAHGHISIPFSFVGNGRLNYRSTGVTSTKIKRPKQDSSIPSLLICSASPTTAEEDAHNKNESSSGVTFLVSPSSFNHLKILDERFLPGEERSSSLDDQKLTPERLKATVASLSSMALVFIGGDELGKMLSMDLLRMDGGIILPLGVAAGILGWKTFGGDELREKELPKDGGYDAKFVVDRPIRLKRILDRIKEEEEFHSNRIIMTTAEGELRDLSVAKKFIGQVHTDEYLQEFQDAVKDAKERDLVRRLNPVVMRTLIDQYSMDAAMHSVADWIDAVDHALPKKNNNKPQSSSPAFALTRPPSHHACQSRAMGGCLLNSIAAAARYALDDHKKGGKKNVAILDIDAHHGNGIAHCIQGDGRIRYCSIHEEVPEKNWFLRSNNNDNNNDNNFVVNGINPRGPNASDRGPLNNILNIPLPKNTGWNNGYKSALMDVALPFLQENRPKILLVAAGFDALAADTTSSLMLKPADYEEMGMILQNHFGNRIAFGLEGGYCWQNGNDLGDAIVHLVKPWNPKP